MDEPFAFIPYSGPKKSRRQMEVQPKQKVICQPSRRDGAYAWGVFEDAADESRMVETFLVESWLEHLR